MKLQYVLCSFTLLFGAGWANEMSAAQPDKPQIMLVGTLSLPNEEFLTFVERVRPDFVVMGAFGAPQWTAQKSPVEWLKKWQVVFERMHRSQVKVIGMIELLNAGNTPEEAARFVDFFEKRWDEKLLGKKPAVTGGSLLEQRTMPMKLQQGAHAPRGCATNPNWRIVEKAFVKALIHAGIDGFITHRNMFGECGCPFCHADWEKRKKPAPRKHVHLKTAVIEVACEHCRGGFRRWLAKRYDDKQLRQRFGIKNLKAHQFAAIYGHHREHGRLPSSIELEAMKYARHSIKDIYDDVFVDFARKVKSDLIVAQWNHMPYFDELHLDGGHIPRFHLTTFAHASANERWSLPLSLWGRGEDFYWYCNWGTCQNTQLEKRFLADVTLYGKLLRSLARGKPFVINKYDFYRPRNMLAEAAGLGMIPGAIQVPYRTAEDAEVMERYIKFLRKHSIIYAKSNGTPVSDVLAVFPRSRIHSGDAQGLEMVEVAGRTMIVDHIQFDLVPDDLLPSVKLDDYKVIVASEPSGLDKKQLASFLKKGGQIIAVPRTKVVADDSRWAQLSATVIRGLQPHIGGKPEAEPFRRALLKSLGDRQPRFTAPYTVEPHVYRQPGRFVVHFVNYNHTEKAPGKSNVAREAPIASLPVGVRLPLPTGVNVKAVTFLDPDADRRRKVAFQQNDGVVTFKTPGFLVYGVCVIELQQAQ